MTALHVWKDGDELYAADINGNFAAVATPDPVTGQLPASVIPASVTQAITAAAAEAAAAQAAASAAQASATAAAAAAEAAQTTATAAQTAASTAGGGGSRVWSVFAGNSNATTTVCEQSAGVGVDHIKETDVGLYTVYLSAGTVLPANYVLASGDQIPAFSLSVGAWIGLLDSGTDDTVAIGGLNRQATKPWGVDPDTGLSFVQIRMTFQAQPVSSPTGQSWAAVFLQINW